MTDKSNTKVIVAQKSPFAFVVKEGKKYWWCSCGRSINQPFCDGSHKETSFSPILFVAQKEGRVYFCGCKTSRKQPLCDGTHTKL